MTIRSSRLLLAAALVLAVTPALAETCIVDYETFEVREILPSDHSGMPHEQSLPMYDWARESRATVAGDEYEKYGLPREVTRDLLEFYGFRDSVPFMKEAGSGPVPEVLYALVNAWGCEVQAYFPVR